MVAVVVFVFVVVDVVVFAVVISAAAALKFAAVADALVLEAVAVQGLREKIIVHGKKIVYANELRSSNDMLTGKQ